MQAWTTPPRPRVTQSLDDFAQGLRARRDLRAGNVGIDEARVPDVRPGGTPVQRPARTTPVEVSSLFQLKF